MVRRCKKSEIEVFYTYTKAQDVFWGREEMSCFPIWNCFSEGGRNKHHIYHGFQRQETTCFLAQGTFWSSM